MKSKYTVADIINLRVNKLDSICNNSWQTRTLHAIRKCRTKELGGHIDECDNCGKINISYNSCRNRHCPTCQGHKVEQWTQARLGELLPVKYFHVVFTIPDTLNDIALKEPNIIYSILFKSAWETLSLFGNNPKHLGAKMGMVSVLHTWGQDLQLHPHLHCIVPSGGVTVSGKWKNSKSKGKFLFPVKSMSKVFRAKFVKHLRKNLPELEQDMYDKLFLKKWVVFAKRPFIKPETVVEYLARYTYKIAISNYRILNIDKETGKVTFRLKDYRKGGKKTSMTLDADEFIRRFSLHILPKGFTKIRHYGFLSSSWKKEKLQNLQETFDDFIIKIPKVGTEIKLNKCRYCGYGNLIPILGIGKRGPPLKYLILEQIKPYIPKN
jgi:hypothetical protein